MTRRQQKGRRSIAAVNDGANNHVALGEDDDEGCGGDRVLPTRRRNDDCSLKGGVPPDNPVGVIDAKIKAAAITAARARRR